MDDSSFDTADDTGYHKRGILAMPSVILEFALAREDVRLHTDRVTVELGNGVRLTTGIPTWVKGINGAKLQIVLDIEGGPPNANTVEPPVK